MHGQMMGQKKAGKQDQWDVLCNRIVEWVMESLNRLLQGENGVSGLPKHLKP